MAHGVGDQLLAFLQALHAATPWNVTTQNIGTASKWRLGGSIWDATVTVDPSSKLKLEFEARDPVTGKRASYYIDTDQYDIMQDGQRDFADAIERDIIEFIENIRRGVALRGNIGSNFVLVFPLNGAYVRVATGHLWSMTASTHAGQAAAQAGGSYVPIV